MCISLVFVHGHQTLSRYIGFCPGIPRSEILTYREKIHFVPVYTGKKKHCYQSLIWHIRVVKHVVSQNDKSFTHDSGLQ